MPLHFRDPLSGGVYQHKGRIRSSRMNGWIGAIRNLDAAALWDSLQFVKIDQTSNVFGAFANELYGYVATLSATNYRIVSLSYPQAQVGDAFFELIAATALPGTPTLSSFAASAGGGPVGGVFVYAGHSYRVETNVYTASRTAFSSITSARDVLWSEYGNQYVACGSNGDGGSVEVSPEGQTWTTQANATSTDIYSKIACDLTGRYILVAPTANNIWGYSDDGGATWAKYTVSVDGDASPNPTGIAYDDRRGVWLATFLDSAFSGDGLKVWSNANPTTATWAATATQVPSSGLVGETVAAISGILVLGDLWLATTYSTSHGNVMISTDGGVTWGVACALNGTSVSPPKIYRSGSYIIAGDANTAGAISGPVYI